SSVVPPAVVAAGSAERTMDFSHIAAAGRGMEAIHVLRHDALELSTLLQLYEGMVARIGGDVVQQLQPETIKLVKLEGVPAQRFDTGQFLGAVLAPQALLGPKVRQPRLGAHAGAGQGHQALYPA